MSKEDRLFTFLMVDDDPDDRMLFNEARDEVRFRNSVEFLAHGEQSLVSL